jgi:superfamily I DNA/RNA helicase
MGWTDRCDTVLRWLIKDWDEVTKKKIAKRGKTTDPAKPFEDVADDADGVETIYKMLHEAAVAAGSLDQIGRQTRSASREGADAVVLSTVHKMKGGQAPVVFATGLRDGMLPHQKATDWEEERRIFYVASTRAMRELIVSCGGPASDFLIELGLAPDWRKSPDEATETDPNLDAIR